MRGGGLLVNFFLFIDYYRVFFISEILWSISTEL
jgi:hypothetical protein